MMSYLRPDVPPFIPQHSYSSNSQFSSANYVNNSSLNSWTNSFVSSLQSTVPNSKHRKDRFNHINRRSGTDTNKFDKKFHLECSTNNLQFKSESPGKNNSLAAHKDHSRTKHDFISRGSSLAKTYDIPQKLESNETKRSKKRNKKSKTWKSCNEIENIITLEKNVTVLSKWRESGNVTEAKLADKNEFPELGSPSNQILCNQIMLDYEVNGPAAVFHNNNNANVCGETLNTLKHSERFPSESKLPQFKSNDNLETSEWKEVKGNRRTRYKERQPRLPASPLEHETAVKNSDSEAKIAKKKQRKKQKMMAKERKILEKRQREKQDTKVQVINSNIKAQYEMKHSNVVNKPKPLRFYDDEYPSLNEKVISTRKSQNISDSDWESVDSRGSTSMNDADYYFSDDHVPQLIQHTKPNIRGILKPSKAEVFPKGVLLVKDKQQKEKRKKPKANTPMSLGDVMILEIPHLKRNKSERVKGSLHKKNKDSGKYTGNLLDVSAPERRRKEREGGKKKKRSCLKKVVLQEREARRAKRLLFRGATMPDVKPWKITEDGNECSSDQTEVSLPRPEKEVVVVDEKQKLILEAIQDMRTNAKLWIHSRTFRDYCNHYLSPEIDSSVRSLLEDLVRFQDRQHLKDPEQSSAKRRLIYGLKEVKKILNLNKVKCVILAPDLEKVPTPGGLDEKVREIMDMSESRDVPVVFSLRKHTLGKVCRKKAAVSAVGILNYQGAEKHYVSVLALVKNMREKYKEAYAVIENNLGQNSTTERVKCDIAEGIAALRVSESQ